MTDYTDEEFMYITKTVMNVLDTWNLTTEQDSPSIRFALYRQRKGSLDKYRTLKALPNDALIVKRLSHVVGISDALRTTFPRNILIWQRNG